MANCLTVAARVRLHYVSYLDERVRDEVVERAAQLSLRSYSGCVMPRLEPVLEGNGAIVGVRVSHPMDMAAQMLEYSSLSRRRAASVGH